ncbi:MFS transporter, partial [Shigella sonnei]|uniref:MFS transporter n=1 Tax=Shigella sonnei TaxID=624 RepID=UPI002092DA52
MCSFSFVLRLLRFSGPKTSIICTPMTSLKTSIKTITYLSDTGGLEIQGASLAVTVNLNKIGFNFTTDQLFLLTALPSVSGALLRVPYSFMVPIFGGRRWTVFSTAILIIPCVWLGIAVQNPNTPFGIFIVIALLCGFAGANFASSMGNISFFFPKAKQGSALGINGGLGNLGVSVM